MDYNRREKSGGVFVYQPHVSQFLIVVGIGFILMFFGYALKYGDIKNLSIDFLKFYIPLYIFVVLYVTKWMYTILDIEKQFLVHRNLFLPKKIIVKDIVKISFGGTYLILTGTYRTLFIFYISPKGEKLLKLNEATFRNEAAISDFLKNLKELNPNIQFDPVAQQLMTEGKVPRRGL